MRCPNMGPLSWPTALSWKVGGSLFLPTHEADPSDAITTCLEPVGASRPGGPLQQLATFCRSGAVSGKPLALPIGGS